VPTTDGGSKIKPKDKPKGSGTGNTSGAGAANGGKQLMVSTHLNLNS